MEREREDLYIKCVECGDEFIFEVGEQEYYKKNNLFIPKRCPACRRAKRLSKEATE